MILKRILKKFIPLALTGVVLLTGCNTGAGSTASTDKPDSTEPGVLSKFYLTEFSDNFGSRVAGTDSEKRSSDWTEKELKMMGYEVKRQNFSFQTAENQQESCNLIVEKKGTTDKQVVITAHLDSFSIGLGADDNASGVALMLEAAKTLKDVQTPQTIKFVFTGANDFDYCGAYNYVGAMTDQELANTLLMINIDSVIAGNNSYVYGDFAPEKGKYRDHILALAKEKNLNLITQEGLNVDFPAGTTGDWSDHVPFKEKNIPYVYFEATDWTLADKDGYVQVDLSYGSEGEIWKTPFDNVEYIEDVFPGRIDEKLKTYSTILQLFLKEDISKI